MASALDLLLLVAQAQQPIWYTSNRVIAGGDPPAGQPLIVQAGTVVVTTGTGGAVSFAWPNPFPNAVMGVVMTAGDTVSGLGFVQGVQGSTSLSTCVANAFNTGGAAIGSGLNVRINFIAVGW